MDVSVVNGLKTSSDFDHVTVVTISGPKVRAQNGRVCCKWAKKLVNFWTCHDRDISGPQKSELKMQIPAANGPNSWSPFGSDVTTVTRVFGPKVRAQNGRVCCRWAKKLVKFRVCHDRDMSFWTKSSTSKWRYLP